jgi:branched-chain amino acid aminotransferase
MTTSQGPLETAELQTTPDNPLAAGCAWIEGEYLPITEARIPILDRGFRFSDCTYDVVAVWEGRFFRLQDHLSRLESGAEKIHIPLPLPPDEIREILIETVRRSGLRNAYVEAVVTRGVSAREGRDPRLLKSRLYAYAIPYVWIVSPELQEEGTKVVVAREARRISPDSVDPTVKNYQWGDFMRGLFEAYSRGASLPLLLDRDGNLTEGAGYNIFLVCSGAIRTPASGVLEGITRRTVLELAEEAGIESVVTDIPVSVVYEADEIFLTSTAGGVMPVAWLDGEKIGEGRPGPVTTLLRERYWKLHSEPRYTLLVDYPE